MIKDTLGLIEKIVTEIRDNVDMAVIGLSGGADSTLVALLCLKALGKENVYGISKIAFHRHKIDSLSKNEISAPVCIRIKPTNKWRMQENY